MRFPVFFRVFPRLRFVIISAVILCGMGIFLAFFVVRFLEKVMLSEMEAVVVDHYRYLTTMVMQGEDLVKLRFGDAYKRFDRRIREHVFSKDVIVIKIYDREGRLLYHSNNPYLEGRTFGPNPNLKRALAGETVITMSSLRSPEHVQERAAGFSKLQEIYLPIRAKQGRQVIGSYEIYLRPRPYVYRIRTMKATVWTIFALGLLLLNGNLFWIIRDCANTMRRQRTALEERAQKLLKSNEDLRKAQAQLIRSERLASAGQMAAGIAHEIGNPLTSVLGLVDLLLTRSDNERRQEEVLERIASEIARVKQIIGNLLDFSRPAAISVGSVDVNRAIEDTLPLVRAQRRFRNVTVRMDLEPTLPLVQADTKQLQQVLVNLLNNAAEAAGEEGEVIIRSEAMPRGEAPLSAAAQDSFVRFSVTDTGGGVEAEDPERIFDPFFTTKGTGEGVGLGLAVSRGLIEKFGGSLELENHPGKGATFHVWLPVKEGDLPGDVRPTWLDSVKGKQAASLQGP
ncbi:MAG: sensor histidine kinase [Nitrospinota bacterium]